MPCRGGFSRRPRAGGVSSSLARLWSQGAEGRGPVLGCLLRKAKRRSEGVGRERLAISRASEWLSLVSTRLLRSFDVRIGKVSGCLDIWIVHRKAQPMSIWSFSWHLSCLCPFLPQAPHARVHGRLLRRKKSWPFCLRQWSPAFPAVGFFQG